MIHGHAAAQVATRIRSCFRQNFDLAVNDVIWNMPTDNTGSAFNIPDLELDGVEGTRCSAHWVALAPRHQLFLHKRKVEGRETKVPHQNAVAAVVEHMEAVRDKHLTCRFNEAAATALKEGQRLTQTPELVPILDSQVKWDSSLQMLDRDWILKTSFDQAALINRRLPCLKCPPEAYLRSRNIAGVIRPWVHATTILQGDRVTLSIVLPCLQVLAKRMDVAAPLQVLTPSSSREAVIDEINEDELDEPSIQLRGKLREEIKTNYHHFAKSEQTMQKASAVDPRFRHVPFMPSAEAAEGLRRHVEKEVVDYWKEQHAAKHGDPSPLQLAAAEAESCRRPVKTRRVIGVQVFPQDMSLLSHPSTGADPPPRPENAFDEAPVRAEVRNWFKAPPVPGVDNVEWWQKEWERWPFIDPVARKYNAVPATVGRVERLWSTAREVLEHTRRSMDKGTVETCLLLSSNLEELGLWSPAPTE